MFIAAANLLAIAMLRVGPETRGRRFDALEDAGLQLEEARR